jgi:hypothetical protein
MRNGGKGPISKYFFDLRSNGPFLNIYPLQINLSWGLPTVDPASLGPGLTPYLQSRFVTVCHGTSVILLVCARIL